MAWVRIDDQFARHPKVMQAGPLAAWLHVNALCYANSYLTDGFIPFGVVRTLADFSELSDFLDGGPHTIETHPEGLAERLVDVGLWELAEGGYRIHDYLEYNPSAADVREQRRQNAERQARWRNQHQPEPAPPPSLEERHAGSNAVTNAASNGPVDALVFVPRTRTPTPTDQETPDHPVEGVQGEQPPKPPRKARGKPARPPCSETWMAIVRETFPKPSAVGLRRLGVVERSEFPPGEVNLRDALRYAQFKAQGDAVCFAAAVLRSDPEFRDDRQPFRRTGTDSGGAGDRGEVRLRSAVLAGPGADAEFKRQIELAKRGQL